MDMKDDTRFIHWTFFQLVVVALLHLNILKGLSRDEYISGWRMYVSVLQFSVQRSVSSGDEIGTSSLRIELSAQFDSILSFDGREIQFFEWFLKTQTNLGICSLCPPTTLIERIFLRLRLSTKTLFTILFPSWFLIRVRHDSMIFCLVFYYVEEREFFYSRERKLSLAVNGKWWAMIFFYG